MIGSRNTLAARLGASLTLGVLFGARGAAAEPRPPAPSERADRYSIHADSTTVFAVFRRALQPGPAGARITTETLAPAHEYVALRVRDVDAPWAADSVDIELSAWGAAGTSDPRLERRFDGDVTIAQVTHRYGPGTLKLGRQLMTAGAARFAHFDGLAAEGRWAITERSGAGGTAYGGFTVLPLWSDRPEYAQLGAAFDTLVDSPEAFEDPKRSGNTVAGGRLFGWYQDLAELGLSLHEARENSELGRRDAALDALVTPIEQLDLVARTLVDLDSLRLSEAHGSATVYPTARLDATAQYRRVRPTLLMSRQSVLSVFAVDAFDELGAEARYRATERLTFSAGGYVELFRDADLGLRAAARTQAIPDPARRVALSVELTRVAAPNNGYVAARLSARYRPFERLGVVGEEYLYVYDEPILGRSTSSVESLNAEVAMHDDLGLLVGGSAFQTPYASSELQALVRLVYEVDRVRGGEP